MGLSHKTFTFLALVAAVALMGAPCDGLIVCVSASGNVALQLHAEHHRCSRELPQSGGEAQELRRGGGRCEPESCPPCVDIRVPRAIGDAGLPPDGDPPVQPERGAPVVVEAAELPPAFDLLAKRFFARPPPETSSVLSSLRTVVLLA